MTQIHKYFGSGIFNGKITLCEAVKKQSNLLINILEFNDRARPRAKANKKKKSNTQESVNTIYEGRELVLYSFKSGIFPLKSTQGNQNINT